MIMRHDGKLPEGELEFFLKGSTSISEDHTKPEALNWIPDSGWNDLYKIDNVSQSFKGLRDSVMAESQVSPAMLPKLLMGTERKGIAWHVRWPVAADSGVACGTAG